MRPTTPRVRRPIRVADATSVARSRPTARGFGCGLGLRSHLRRAGPHGGAEGDPLDGAFRPGVLRNQSQTRRSLTVTLQMAPSVPTLWKCTLTEQSVPPPVATMSHA